MRKRNTGMEQAVPGSSESIAPEHTNQQIKCVANSGLWGIFDVNEFFL